MTEHSTTSVPIPEPAPAPTPNAAPEDAAAHWRRQYDQAARRARLLATTTVVATAAAVAAGVWGVQAQQAEDPAGGGPFPAVAGQGPDLQSLFAEDGSIDPEALDELVAALPDGGPPIEQLVQFLEAQGQLTADQARALLDALAEQS
jgi:hypothetical protein